MFWFANDIAVLTENEREMNERLCKVDEKLSEEYNMRISIGKTKIMMWKETKIQDRILH